MNKFLTATVLAVAASTSVGATTAGAAPPSAAATHEITITGVSARAVASHAAARGVSPAVRAAARTVTMERVYGSYYRIYKERYPNALDWDNNGCSVPFSVPIVNHYKNLFQKSCDRHDFGYRNHGKSGYDRLTVDNRFKSNMKHQCDVVYDDWYDVPARVLCKEAADEFYNAVRLFGGGHW